MFSDALMTLFYGMNLGWCENGGISFIIPFITTIQYIVVQTKPALDGAQACLNHDSRDVWDIHDCKTDYPQGMKVFVCFHYAVGRC